MTVFSDKKTIFAVLVLILVLIVVGAGLWFFTKKLPETQKEGIVPLSKAELLTENPPGERKIVSLPAFLTEEPEKTPKKDDFSAFFEETAERVFVSIEELKKQFLPPVSENPILLPPSAPHAISNVSAFFMSDEEYFKRAYPPGFIKALNTLQDLMIREGFIKDSEKMTFKTEADTYVLFNKFLDFAAFRGDLPKEDIERFKAGVNVTLRDLNKFERPFVEKRLRSVSAFSEIFGQLMRLLVKKAEALAFTYPDCYAEGGGGSPAGYNSWSYCCNCGYFCSYGCTYISDCNPTGSSCNVSSGCLNLMCSGQNGIWDPMTGICGCG